MKLKNRVVVIFLAFLSLYLGISCSLLTANTKKPSQGNTLEANTQTPLEKIAETLTKKITTPNARLIVLTFTTTEGKEHKLGSLFAEKLTTDLVRRESVVVLDRLLFAKQIQAHQLTLSSGSDLSEMKKIGELLGLHAIVTGMITSFNNGYGLNCRIIDPKTGFILAAEEAFYAGE
ncbi:MAG: curli production assembly/transport component CsgG domain protein [Leptospiraceae bacterium]|nr:curli production assembly/transport component CsgG domain protein [Leptospiraceae bacterium]MBK9499193.1 curli production assembly/transport component CsgG domain protein [Leptospiraceae bacterium]MBP9165247.1 curli production assembly/transport component CsgG domain protein [Leptospiraceae bacterium]